MRHWLGLCALLLASPALSQATDRCALELAVLGTGQDAGAPQIGNPDDKGPRLLPSSLALIDREAGKRYLFDASPAITEQLTILDSMEPPQSGLGIDGIFLTHAHIGHYLGLAYLGLEAAGASDVAVYAMPRMAEFLRSNGPWSQLVELGNIELTEFAETSAIQAIPLSSSLVVIPLPAPHRDEYSETVGFWIMTPSKRAIYLPDLDSWHEFEKLRGQSLENMLAQVDHAFVDATFYDDGELFDENGKGRDMSAIPHPRVKKTMDRLQHLPAEEREKVHFIHYNHTNPIRDPGSAQSKEVQSRGFNVARTGDSLCLAE